MIQTGIVSRIQVAVSEAKVALKRRIENFGKYDEAARAYRCARASEQAERTLEELKSGMRGDIHRQGFIR